MNVIWIALLGIALVALILKMADSYTKEPKSEIPEVRNPPLPDVLTEKDYYRMGGAKHPDHFCEASHYPAPGVCENCLTGQYLWIKKGLPSNQPFRCASCDCHNNPQEKTT